LLFHNEMDGLRQFLKLVHEKAASARDEEGKRRAKGTPEYGDFEDVEVITEFHIARDLAFEGRGLADIGR